MLSFAPVLERESLGRRPAAEAAQEEGEQLAATGDLEVPVESDDILVDSADADPQTQRRLLLTVALQQCLQRLAQPRRQTGRPHLLGGGQGTAQKRYHLCLAQMHQQALAPPERWVPRGPVQDHLVVPVPPRWRVPRQQGVV